MADEQAANIGVTAAPAEKSIPLALGGSRVGVLEATQGGDGPHVATGHRRRCACLGCSWDPQCQTLVRSIMVEVLHVVAEDAPQLGLAQDQDVVEALAPDATEEPLAGRVLPGRAIGAGQARQAASPERMRAIGRMSASATSFQATLAYPYWQVARCAAQSMVKSVVAKSTPARACQLRSGPVGLTKSSSWAVRLLKRCAAARYCRARGPGWSPRRCCCAGHPRHWSRSGEPCTRSTRGPACDWSAPRGRRAWSAGAGLAADRRPGAIGTPGEAAPLSVQCRRSKPAQLWCAARMWSDVYRP